MDGMEHYMQNIMLSMHKPDAQQSVVVWSQEERQDERLYIT